MPRYRVVASTARERECALQCVDGAPTAGFSIAPSANAVALSPRIVRACERGRASLALTPGSFRVEGCPASQRTDHGSRRRWGATFEWASAGLEPSSVALEVR